jgi:hypothetical protein
MKRDGRGFDHRTLEAIRSMAVERVRGGERPSSVVASFGFHRTTIYRWLNAASKPGVGVKALHSRPATGRPRSLGSASARIRVCPSVPSVGHIVVVVRVVKIGLPLYKYEPTRSLV